MTARIFFCGEALIDFITPDGLNYRAATGGSPFNAAKAAARAGADAHFCGSVSHDLFGEMILSDLDLFGVDSTHAPRSDRPTVLGFVQVTEDEHPIYAFFDRESCMVNMQPELPPGLCRSGDVMVIGSISLIVSPGADRIEEFALTQTENTILAVDPNVRPTMISGHDGWYPRIMRLLNAAAIIKISTEDLDYLKPGISSENFALERLKQGSSLIIVTDGEKGASAWSRNGNASVNGIYTTGGDTVGAGDTIMGFSLAWLAEREYTLCHRLDALDDAELETMLTFANMAAAINCESVGCAPPFRDDVEKRIAQAQPGQAS